MACRVHSNILVVDGDEGVRASLAAMLTTPACQVSTAALGNEALRQLLKTDFSLILLAMDLPDMDGYEVATLIRQVKRSCHIPIVFLTAGADPERLAFRGCGLSTVEYIAKPVDGAQLQSLVALLAEQCSKSGKSEISKVGDDLEAVVRERTASLIRANELLRREVFRREVAENDLYKAKREAEAANLAKSEFLANMSHEIRTPINGIIGLVELALQTRLSTEQREYLNLTKVSAGALLTVINDILDFSKIEAGSLEVEHIPFSLRETLGDTLKTLASEAFRKGIELTWAADGEVPDKLIGDPCRLRQIVINLVGNAIKFTDQGEVVLQVRGLGRDRNGDIDAGHTLCEFTVSDSGIGIAPDKLDSIFAPFLQADTSTSRLYGGTGLGLTIAARLVELMGGHLGVQSRPGAGSVFRFALPLEAAEGQEPSDAFAGLRVLVAEDHPVSRQLLTATLRHWQITVDEVEDRAAALAAVQQAQAAGRPYDLAVLDASLPDGDGYTLAADLSKLPDGVGAVVVAGSITAWKDHRDQLESASFACLAKPLKPSDLLTVLRSLGADPPAVAALETPAVLKPAVSYDVLLVEDNAINRRVAQQILVTAGHRVSVADSGQAALDAVAKQHFDVVLMDVQMPGMDGIEATTRIRLEEQITGEHLPIIALTAHAMAQHRERCLLAGMDACLVKPVRPEALLQAIAGLEVRQEKQQGAARRRRTVLEQEGLLEQTGGDRAFLAEIVELFMDRGLELVAEGRRTLEARERESFAAAVHTLLGMCRSLSAPAATDSAFALEQAAATAAWPELEGSYQDLEMDLERLKGELQAMLSALEKTGGEMEAGQEPLAAIATGDSRLLAD